MNLCDYQLDGSESLPAPTRLNTLILISFFLQGCLPFITFFLFKERAVSTAVSSNCSATSFNPGSLTEQAHCDSFRLRYSRKGWFYRPLPSRLFFFFFTRAVMWCLKSPQLSHNLGWLGNVPIKSSLFVDENKTLFIFTDFISCQQIPLNMSRWAFKEDLCGLHSEVHLFNYYLNARSNCYFPFRLLGSFWPSGSFRVQTHRADLWAIKKKKKNQEKKRSCNSQIVVEHFVWRSPLPPDPTPPPSSISPPAGSDQRAEGDLWSRSGGVIQLIIFLPRAESKTKRGIIEVKHNTTRWGNNKWVASTRAHAHTHTHWMTLQPRLLTKLSKSASFQQAFTRWGEPKGEARLPPRLPSSFFYSKPPPPFISSLWSSSSPCPRSSSPNCLSLLPLFLPPSLPPPSSRPPPTLTFSISPGVLWGFDALSKSWFILSEVSIGLCIKDYNSLPRPSRLIH